VWLSRMMLLRTRRMFGDLADLIVVDVRLEDRRVLPEDSGATAREL
jgi:hypothetical protein